MRDLQQLAQIYCQRAAQEWECLPAETGQQAPLRDVFFHLQAVQETERRRPEEMSDLIPSEERLQSAGIGGPWREATVSYSPTPVGKVLAEQNRLVVLGEPGAGKSTLLQFIGLTYARGTAAVQEEFGLEEDLCPVRVSLQLTAGAMLTQPEGIVSVLEEAVWALLPGDLADAKALLADWIKCGKLAVLLDGLDEIPAENRSGVITKIRALHNKLAAGSSRIIIASRRAGYAEYPPGKPFAEFSLVPLKPEQAQQYLQKWLQFLEVQNADQHAANILEVVRQHPALRRMSDNPLALKLLALHFQEKDEQQPSKSDREKVATSRAELYRSWVRHAWKRARERGATGDYQAVEETLVRLAWDQQMEKPVELSDAEQKIVREQMGLVAQVGNGQIVFAHKTVQEFLVALRLQECWVKHQTWTKRFLRLRLHLPEWREPLLLLAGSLNKQSVDALVNWVLNARSPGESILLRDFVLASKMLIENPLANAAIVHKKHWRLTHHQKEQMRQLAVLALGEIGDQEAVTSLQKALTDTNLDVRVAAAWALGEIGDPETVPILRETLKHTDSNVRKAIIRAVGKIGGPEAVATLREALKHKDAHMRQVTAWAMADNRNRETLQVLQEGRYDTDELVRLSVAVALREIGEPEALPTLIEMLKDINSLVRWIAAGALGEIGGPEAVTALREALMDTDESVRSTAAEALGEIGGPEAVAGLREALKDKSEYVRLTAAETLDNLGSLEMMAAIWEALKDENGSIRWTGAGDLESVPDLREILKDTNVDVRRAAARALGKIDGPEAVTALQEALMDADEKVRLAAAEALGEIGGPEAVAGLREALKDKSAYVRLTAAESMGAIGGLDVVADLREALKDSHVDVRWATVWALAEIDVTEAVTALREALKDIDGSVRSSAAKALGEIGGPEAVAALRDALKDPDAVVRRTAAEAIIKILNNPNNLRRLTSDTPTLRQIERILKEVPQEYSKVLKFQARYELIHDTYTDPRLPPPISQQQRIGTVVGVIALLLLAGGLISLIIVYSDTIQDRYEADVASTWVALIPQAWLLPIMIALAGLLVVFGVLLVEPVKDMVKALVWKKEKTGK